MKYHYRIWCPYCLGEDPQGCFDGVMYTDYTPFDTAKAAEEAGWEVVGDGTLEFEVIDEKGNIVEVEAQ